MIAYTVACPGCGQHWVIYTESLIRTTDHWCSVCDAYTAAVVSAGVKAA